MRALVGLLFRYSTHVWKYWPFTYSRDLYATRIPGYSRLKKCSKYLSDGGLQSLSLYLEYRNYSISTNGTLLYHLQKNCQYFVTRLRSNFLTFFLNPKKSCRYRNAQNSSVQENRDTLHHGSLPHLQCEKWKQNRNFFNIFLFRISLQFSWLSPFYCNAQSCDFLSLNLRHTIEQKIQSRGSWC